MNAGANEFENSLLSAHNRLRAQHNSPPLKWSKAAAAKAKEWAEHLVRSGKLEHGNHTDMGQNLAYRSGDGGGLTGEGATDMWYQEIHSYNYNQPGFGSNTGHFTQVVWASTTHVGAALAKDGNKSVVVANYLPPGNITNSGEFEKNVKRAN